MSEHASVRAAPPTEGALMRVTPTRRAGPWLIGLALLIPLPWLTLNEYQDYLLDVICINIILAVGLNIVWRSFEDSRPRRLEN